MSNTRYSMNMHIAAARRQAQASEELLAKLKPHLKPMSDEVLLELAHEGDPYEQDREDHAAGEGMYAHDDEETP